MNKLILFFSFAALTFTAAAQQILSVVWENDPGAFATRFSREPERWSFHRPAAGKNSCVTAVSAAQDAEALYLDIYCGESDAERINSFAGPENMLEIRLFPGDGEGTAFLPECRIGIETNMENVFQYASLKPDRDFVESGFRVSVSRRNNGCFVHIELPWIFFADRLPNPEKPENFWRLAVSRNHKPVFGGNTEKSSVAAGYLRLPALTAEQETALLGAVLRRAWIQGRKNNGGARLNDDPDLRAIRQKLAAFSRLPLENARAFYRENALKLVNAEVNGQRIRRERRLDDLFRETVNSIPNGEKQK